MKRSGITRNIFAIALAVTLLMPATTFARHDPEPERILRDVIGGVLDAAVSGPSTLAPHERARIADDVVRYGRRYGMRINFYEDAFPVAEHELRRLLRQSGSDLVLHVSVDRSRSRDIAEIRYAYRHYGSGSLMTGTVRIDRRYLLSRVDRLLRTYADRFENERRRDLRYRHDDRYRR